MTVAMALAENLHHSAKRWREARTKAYGHRRLSEPLVRGPASCRSRSRREAVTDGFVAVPVPSLAVPLLAGAAGEAVDSSSLRHLTAAALRLKEEEERQKELEREEAKERADETQSLLAVPRALRTPAQVRRFQALAARSSDTLVSLRRRKRKKRRKKKTSKSSSSCGHARRRQRQWHARFAGFPGHVPLRAVFPSAVVRPAAMLGIMADMDQKDSTTLVYNGSGMCRVGFSGDDAPRVISLLASPSPGCSASWPVWTRRTVTTWCTWSRLLKLWSLRSCSPFRSSTSLSWRRGSLSWSRLFVGP